jgi:hypothetical protein
MAIGKIGLFSGLLRNFGFFKKLFLFIFVFLAIVSSITYGIQEKDIGAGLTKMGSQVLSPIENSYNLALSVNEGNLIDTVGFLWSLYSIFIWVFVLKWLVQNIIIMDDSRKTNSWIGAIIIFLLIQVAYLGFKGVDLNILWKMWSEILNAIKNVLSGDLISNTFQVNNTCTEGICKI